MNNPTSEKIKPCPFCGHWAADVCDILFSKEDEQETKYYVRCNRCEGSGPYEDIEIDAVKSWNVRVNQIVKRPRRRRI